MHSGGYCTVRPTSSSGGESAGEAFFFGGFMKNYLLDYYVTLADAEMDGYELLALVSHMSNYCGNVFTKEQREMVDAVEEALNYIYVRDSLEEVEAERQADRESVAEDGTDTDD